LLANAAFPEELGSLLATEYAATGAALRGLVRKCLVLDLDDTLWGGVVGELGPDGIQIGPSYPGNIYQAIQHAARRAHEDGVLLALNSSNNEADAWQVFERRKDMVLERRHFSAYRINWRDKVDNLREMADELNLGLDSIVVLDNDPVHQAWIEERLPEVHVIPASDALDMLQALAAGRLFAGYRSTAQDRARPQSYVAAARRRTEETAAADRETFLAGLGLTVNVGRATPDALPRLAQMAQRTNQFNLTTRRYTESQIAALCASPEVEVLWAACCDRFADEGITGLAILRGPGDEWLIDTFLLSCRVLGRGVERALAAAVCRTAAARGVRHLRGEYIRTPRNTPAADFYREIGFTAV
jgi:FkbH-like protein